MKEETKNVTSTIRCEGLCDDVVFTGQTVDVVIGAEVDRDKTTISLTGIGSARPVEQKWCTDCAYHRFGVDQSAFHDRVKPAKKYVTASNVASFLAGVALVTLFVLMV